MKRIAWIVPSGVAGEDSPLHIPALSNLALELAEKVELTVFSFSSERTLRSPNLGNATVHYLPSAWNAPMWKRAYSLVPLFLKEHHHKPFDLVHGFWALPCGFLAVALGRWLGIRSTCSFLGGETAAISDIRYGNMRTWHARAATLWVSRRSALLHLLTQFQRSGLAAYQADLPHHVVFPFGVDTSLFSPETKRLSRPIRILQVANLTEVKDQETLLRSFSHIVENIPARLRIVGPDFMGGSLQRLACELGLEDTVEFLGPLAHRSIHRHYRWAHLYLQTSLHEGQGISVLEAMASGVVVGGTRVGMLADLPSSCCVVTPPKQPKLLADAILEIVNNTKRYEHIRKNALQWARSHDLSFTVGKLTALYEGKSVLR
ncbi:MAG TPA: glycosyltransferase [Bacteroidota bacterium]|nr:glycosyltransferase [Bacteroidota bacterium]